MFRATITALPLLFSACTSALPSEQPALPVETMIQFEASTGETVSAFEGWIEVPENRSAADSRMIELHYVRFPATGEVSGPPIIYLAGGPGGSGIHTARGRRFPLFMAMREYGDVIALDQRGTGVSDDTPVCETDVPDFPLAGQRVEDWIDELRVSAHGCLEFWTSAGVDYRGYTTAESVADLDALRLALGVDKISLWGISYGSHLALAAMKDLGPSIDRVVIASAEGLDQTVKRPSENDAFISRLSEAFAADPELSTAFPDAAELIRRVHARLRHSPLSLSVPLRNGDRFDLLVSEPVMQQLASGGMADPDGAVTTLHIYAALDEGITEPLSMLVPYFLSPDGRTDFRVMPLIMDVASGISPQRLSTVQSEAESAIMSDYVNFPMPQFAGEFDVDLGEDFRAAPVGDVPVLLLTGTLDGRTYPTEQREAVSGLTDVTQVVVENAGHNLFMASPEVTEVIESFMSGRAVETDTIFVDLPGLPDFSSVD